MDFLDEIIELISASIRDDADISITNGNIIKPGFDPEIDRDLQFQHDSQIWISDYQKKLIQETGISNLKIKYTSAQGYFIELPHAQSGKILSHFIPRQSLSNAVRYTTDELRIFEFKLQSINTNLHEKEYIVFNKIRHTILGQYINLYELSRNISSIDFLTNGAYISLSRGYETPKMTEKYELTIEGGKHPVIANREKEFMSNNLIQQKNNYIHVITGPNMGGKSTFLRQNALLILIAHLGYDIPASSAIIPLTDKIFSRVGAGDNLYLGQSTFMVEMQEISYILRHATKKSFVIIDEIGRGTSTYDGMSLAWSIVEYIQKNIRAKTLFATHYHEIIDLAENLAGCSNYSVSVGENESNIIFLRKVIPGGIKKSYGIEVAALAGVPEEILQNARNCIQKFSNNSKIQQLSFDYNISSEKNYKNSQSLYPQSQEIIDMLKNVDTERITPLESLLKIIEIQKKIQDN